MADSSPQSCDPNRKEARHPKAVIIRHRKERLSKCSLKGLESRSDLVFARFPDRLDGLNSVPDWSDYLCLALDGPELSHADVARGLVLIDGTWRLAPRIERGMADRLTTLERRSIPNGFSTAYPRKQTACDDPERGLASVEALYVAYRVLGWPAEGLLEHYVWRDEFLKTNAGAFDSLGC